jgi:hypothetical protein
MTLEEFMQRFRDALSVGDRRTMERLFEREQTLAIAYVITTAMDMGSNPNEQLAKELEAQKKAWEAVYETRFVSNMERYYAFLRPQVRDTLREKAREFVTLAAEARPVLNNRDSERRQERLPTYRARSEEFAKFFDDEGVKDRYYAGEAWLLVADLANGDYVPKEIQNGSLALEAYRKSLAHREEIGLVNDDNDRIEKTIERLEEIGFAEGGGAAPTAAIELGSARLADGEFEAEDEVTRLERPSYLTDEVYLTWNRVVIEGPKGSTGVTGVKDGPTLERTGAASIRITGSDGESQELSLNNTIQLVRTTVGTGSEQRPWGFLIVDPGAQEFFNTVPMNMAAGANFLTLHLAPAASRKFEIGGEEVRVFDDNLDGIYGGPVTRYGRPGVATGEYDAAFDSMLVGRSKRAVPFSRLVEIDDQWYQLEPVDGGLRLRHTPATLRTGTLRLEADGVEFDWYVVEGLEELEGAMFDLADARRGLEVPVGTYRLVSAGVREGKRSNVAKAIAVPPLEDAATVSVPPDGEATVVGGEPYGFDFEFRLEKGEIVIDGTSVTVVGAGGERYHRIWNARPEPKIEIRKAGSTRGREVGAMQTVWNTQEIIDVGVDRAWKPLDARVDNPHGAEVEVRLVEEGNDLFDDIEGTWRGPGR